MDDSLVAIFDECIEVETPSPTPAPLAIYDDGNAYLERGRQKKKKSKKPLPPSQQAIVEFYQNGETENLVKTFLGRSLVIGSALFLFGKNENNKSLVRNSLVASASIEAFLFYWYEMKHKKG